MKQILLKRGGAVVETVPAPIVGEKAILVGVHYSCVSVGTESSGLAAVNTQIYKRALRRPKAVQQVFQMLRNEGLSNTIGRVRGILDTGHPTGYSAAGVVLAVGNEVEGFKVGDRVACGGAGIANHAEVINVPVNLAVHVPDTVQLQDASTVILGAIALQGVRRATPTLGETIGVVGLGVLGQLTVQLLKASGCRVIGADLSPSRTSAAQACGMDHGVDPTDFAERIRWLTDGVGVDAVLVTAATPSHEVISQALQACRRKGRVVLVGDVGLNLRREDLYPKEIDFLISTSYGPGRYDPYYELEGQDYPLAYVRWTENRNMAAYVALLADGKINLPALNPQVTAIDQAPALYRELGTESENKPLLSLLSYPGNTEVGKANTILVGPLTAPLTGKIGVAIIGAGSFAQEMHLPNLVKLRDDFSIRWVISRTGSTAWSAAKRFQIPNAGTDWEVVLADPDVHLVLIATRHDLHADMALQALRAGKHVLVEKPLSMTRSGLEAIKAFYAAPEDGKPILMTGFNRRYSPPIRHIRQLLQGTGGPMMISYRVNAGYLPPDHWVHGREGGGRNIGEACHVYDLFGCLTQAKPIGLQAAALTRCPGGTRANENFSATLRYADGSLATLMYSALGAKSYPKERMEIYADGSVISLDDYRSVVVEGRKDKGWTSSAAQKGQFELLQVLAHLIRRGSAEEWHVRDQIVASEIAFAVEEMINSPGGIMDLD